MQHSKAQVWPLSAAFENTKKAFNHYSKKVFWYSKNQIENFLFGNKRKGTSGMLTGLSKKMEENDTVAFALKIIDNRIK
jgi:hypothetical protein